MSRPWQTLLQVPSTDTVNSKFAYICNIFESLELPEEYRKSEYYRFNDRTQGHDDEPSTQRYGPVYFFGKYSGRPQSAQQNAASAVYHNRQGVELWRILKSVALSCPNGDVFIVHLRGDRSLDVPRLAEYLDIDHDALTPADVLSIGATFGTVSPFIASSSRTINHIFDSDLIEGTEYPNDPIVFASSGDVRFYAGFDVHFYLKALPLLRRCCLSNADTKRIFARQKIQIIGGDSGSDTFAFSNLILTAMRQLLADRNSYFGDRSLAQIDVRSDPTLAGSIAIDLYTEMLTSRVYHLISELRARNLNISGNTPILTFSSFAMHGIARDIAALKEHFSYITPQLFITSFIQASDSLGVEFDAKILLGLPSTYNSAQSAFDEATISMSVSVDQNAQKKLIDLIYDCKLGRAQPKELFATITILLKRATRGDLGLLKNRNVMVILAATELEQLIERAAEPSPDFNIVISNQPSANELARNTDPNKIRLIILRPSFAVAEMIASSALGI